VIRLKAGRLTRPGGAADGDVPCRPSGLHHAMDCRCPLGRLSSSRAPTLQGWIPAAPRAADPASQSRAIPSRCCCA